MKWRVMDQYYAESDCGRYRVCRVRVARERTYQAWTTASGNKPSQPIMIDCQSAKEAQEACVDHAANQPNKT